MQWNARRDKPYAPVDDLLDRQIRNEAREHVCLRRLEAVLAFDISEQASHGFLRAGVKIHLGCTEWIDSSGSGYHPTGLPEMFAVWTTQGEMFKQTRNTVITHNLARTALMRPPAQFGVGAAFQSAGVPQVGAIAAPEYLLTISPDGDLDKLDEHLAARQIAWVADLARRLDSIPASTLRQGDPTLGVGAP